QPISQSLDKAIKAELSQPPTADKVFESVKKMLKEQRALSEERVKGINTKIGSVEGKLKATNLSVDAEKKLKSELLELELERSMEVDKQKEIDRRRDENRLDKASKDAKIRRRSRIHGL